MSNVKQGWVTALGIGKGDEYRLVNSPTFNSKVCMDEDSNIHDVLEDVIRRRIFDPFWSEYPLMCKRMKYFM